MKKLTVLVFVLVCIFTLSACNQSQGIEDTTAIGTDTVETKPTETEPTETEPIAIKLGDLNPDISDSTQVGDIMIPEHLSEYLIDKKGNLYLILPVSKVKTLVSDRYRALLNNIDVELLKIAEESIAEQTSAYTGTPAFYLSTDMNGYLCLGAELIVYIDPPNVETVEGGAVIGAGCNIDHEHKFFLERITK